MSTTPYSLVVTTLNNDATLQRCLGSVPGAEEIIVLDSGSEDGTREIAEAAGARWFEQSFAGYGPQKQAAIDRAAHDWVLLLDADEALSDELAAEIDALMATEKHHPAYRLPRAEWLFWRWPHRWTRLTDHLRLFNRQVIHFDDHPVHAAPKTDQATGHLSHRLLHFGEPDLTTRVRKLNRYARDGAAWQASRNSSVTTVLKLFVAPPTAFLRDYVGRRHFINGLAGFITAACSAIAAFLRYAYVVERRKRNQQPPSRPHKPGPT